MAQLTLSQVKGLLAQINDSLGGAQGDHWYETLTIVMRGEMPETLPTRDGFPTLGRAIPRYQYLDELKATVIDRVKQDAYITFKKPVYEALCSSAFSGQARINTAVLAISPAILGMCGEVKLGHMLEVADRKGLEPLPLQIALSFLLDESQRQSPKGELSLFISNFRIRSNDDVQILFVESTVTDFSPPNVRHPTKLRCVKAAYSREAVVAPNERFLYQRK